MKDRTISEGIYDLGGRAGFPMFKEVFNWLTQNYKKNNLNPKHIRRDVIKFAEARGCLNEYSFEQLVWMYFFRYLKMARNSDARVENDNDPYPLGYTYVRKPPRRGRPKKKPKCREEKYAAKDFPILKWPLFKIVGGIRIWTRDQMEDAIIARHRLYPRKPAK